MVQPEQKAANMPPATDSADVSPEEQAIYDMMVREALGIIYPEDDPGNARPQILENLRGEFDQQVMQMFAQAEPPVQQTAQDALAVTAVILTMMVEAMLAQKGTDVADDVAFYAGAEIIELLVELAETVGIADFQQNEVDDIALRAMDLYRMASPRVDTEALTAEFEEIIAAGEAGKLNDLLPGAEQYAQSRGGA